MPLNLYTNPQVKCIPFVARPNYKHACVRTRGYILQEPQDSNIAS